MQIKSKQFELNEFNELKSLTTSKLALTIANENAYDVFWCCIIRSKPPLSSIHPLKKQQLMLYKNNIWSILFLNI